MLLRGVKGQQQAERLLGSALSDGRLAHAYLFAGPEGTGKLTSALALASAVMCRESETWCGECRHCRRIAGLDHPDARITLPTLKSTTPEEVSELMRARVRDGITPLRVRGNSYIGIDHIRELEGRLARPAFESGWRVEILVDAHRMTQQAANALLKSLEEPPEDTLIVLLTSAMQWLLPTIRSRAHLVRFGRVEPAVITEELLRRCGIDRDAAERLAAASDGSPGRALAMAAEGEEPSGEAVTLLKRIREAESETELIGLAGSVAKTEGTEGARELLAGLRTIVHDMMRVAASSNPIYHPFPDLPDWGIPSGEAVTNAVAALGRAETRMDRHVPPAMALLPALLTLRNAMEGDG